MLIQLEKNGQETRASDKIEHSVRYMTELRPFRAMPLLFGLRKRARSRIPRKSLSSTRLVIFLQSRRYIGINIFVVRSGARCRRAGGRSFRDNLARQHSITARPTWRWRDDARRAEGRGPSARFALAAGDRRVVYVGYFIL
ncbi:hypothetical protein EVAR_4464_1 [Eumeta japonica]|uniref:Uncharacterized protein n=1 Tax=Eumeta variegata TaxID=151549 RepID=A0A4C1T0S3_EUMVA|nr:hypothetical protein EVAR_4464_1 [Eumeta japonica]